MPASKKNVQKINRKRALVKAGFKGEGALGKKNATISDGSTTLPLWTRAESAKRKKLHLILKKKAAAPKAAAPAKVEKQAKTKKFGKKSAGDRLVGQALSKLAASEVVVRAKTSHKSTPAKVRSSIQPGKVLILLAGRFAGKRVVVLKIFKSGLLLVTGPFKLNGVPLRRVNPAYVIATSSAVELPKAVVDAVAALNETDFAGQGKQPKTKLADDEAVKRGEKKQRPANPEVEARTPERVKLQETIDEQLIAAVSKVEFLSDYLKARFTLSPGQYPHELKF